MVSDGKVNICSRCGEELLGRAEVEAIVTGKVRVNRARAHMMWQTFVSGHAYVYAEINGVTGARGETKNIVCGCNVQLADTSSMTMIREEHREVVRGVFGDALSLPLLFNLPVEMVAWENSGIVCVDDVSGGLMLSAEGVGIIEYVADMSKRGLFEDTSKNFSATDVLLGFSYLHMVKTTYRSFAAMELGPDATIEQLFRGLPVDWFDWDNIMMLRADYGGRKGALRLSRAVGAPLSSEIAVELAAKIRGSPSVAVCEGSVVTTGNTCVQLMPNDLYNSSDGDGRFASFDDHASDVVLNEGQAFIPAGPVRLRADSLAVTFEPGVMLRTRGDAVVKAVGAAVTLFLNGVAEIELEVPGFHWYWPDDLDHGGVTRRAFQIAVVCESYAADTQLGNWYATIFDVRSTDARFYTAHAELVLLSSRKMDVKGLPLLPMLGGQFSSEAGDGRKSCEVWATSWRSRFVARSAGEVFIGGGTAADLSAKVLLNDAVMVGAGTAVATIDDVVVVIRPPDSSILFTPGGDPLGAIFARIVCAVPLDAYAIDGGGPSDTEGEYFDETVLYGSAPSMDALRNLAELCAVSVTGFGHDYGEIRWPQQVPAMSYLMLARHPADMAHKFGFHPTFRDLLSLSADQVVLSYLWKTGWRYERGKWQLIMQADYDMTWYDLTKLAVGWFRSSAVNEKSVMKVLLDKFRIPASEFEVDPTAECG